MNDPLIQSIAAALFAAALLHTFATKVFHTLAHGHPRHAGLFHLLGEVEVVFGFWAMVLVVAASRAGTVIANAPNPAGVALLRRGFNDESIGAGGMLAGASLPTAVACAAFLLL